MINSVNKIKTVSTSENIENISLVDFESYVWYRDRSKHCTREHVKDFVEYGTIIRAYYKTMTEMLVDSKGGAFIQDFGYIGFLKYRGKFKRTRNFVNKMFTAEDVYYTMFVPLMRPKKSLMYSMDSSYAKSFLTLLKDRLKKGHHYMYNASLFFINRKKKRNKFDNL